MTAGGEPFGLARARARARARRPTSAWSTSTPSGRSARPATRAARPTARFAGRRAHRPRADDHRRRRRRLPRALVRDRGGGAESLRHACSSASARRSSWSTCRRGSGPRCSTSSGWPQHRRCSSRARNALGVPGGGHRAVPEGARRDRRPRWRSTSTASSRSRRPASPRRDADGFDLGGPRPGLAVRDRDAHLRVADRPRPARAGRRGARGARRSELAHRGEPRARPAQDGARRRGRSRAWRRRCSSCSARAGEPRVQEVQGLVK